MVRVFEAPATSGIYSIHCSSNGRRYIGSAVDLSRRAKNHFYHLTAGTHHSKHLQHAWKKYGESSFRFEVLQLVSRDSLRASEQIAIDAVPAAERFNLSPTAGSVLGFKQDPAIFEKLRAAHLGKKHTEETKARMSAMKKGIATRPAGWKMTEEQRDKVRRGRLGKPLSQETKAKLSKLLTGRRHTETAKLAIGVAHRRFSEQQVAEIRVLYGNGASCAAIARDRGVKRHTIAAVVVGRHPYNFGEPLTIERRQVSFKGRPGRAWTPEQKQKARLSHLGKAIAPETAEKIRQSKIQYWQERQDRQPKGASGRFIQAAVRT